MVELAFRSTQHVRGSGPLKQYRFAAVEGNLPRGPESCKIVFFDHTLVALLFELERPYETKLPDLEQHLVNPGTAPIRA